MKTVEKSQAEGAVLDSRRVGENAAILESQLRAADHQPFLIPLAHDIIGKYAS